MNLIDDIQENIPQDFTNDLSKPTSFVSIAARYSKNSGFVVAGMAVFKYAISASLNLYFSMNDTQSARPAKIVYSPLNGFLRKCKSKTECSFILPCVQYAYAIVIWTQVRLREWKFKPPFQNRGQNNEKACVMWRCFKLRSYFKKKYMTKFDVSPQLGKHGNLTNGPLITTDQSFLE